MSAPVRGGVYRVDLGGARGHEQRGKRFGLVLSVVDWSVRIVVPTSTRAQEAIFRPEIELNGQQTRLLVDQMRAVDVDYIQGPAVMFLDRPQTYEVEQAVARYLGL